MDSIFVLLSESHEKTQNNSVLVRLSALSDLSILSVALSSQTQKSLRKYMNIFSVNPYLVL